MPLSKQHSKIERGVGKGVCICVGTEYDACFSLMALAAAIHPPPPIDTNDDEDKNLLFPACKKWGKIRWAALSPFFEGVGGEG